MGKLGRDISRTIGKTGNHSGSGGGGCSRRISKMDHPRLCPRPVVCLHHGSAKRISKTGARGGSVQEEGGGGGERVKRMKSSRLHFVTEGQNFRG